MLALSPSPVLSGLCRGSIARSCRLWAWALLFPAQWHPRSTGAVGVLGTHLNWGLAGECQLPQHQPCDPDAGPTERAAAPVPAAAAADGAQQEVPWLPAQQLPQPAALLATTLLAQGQGQHLPGEREGPAQRGGLGSGARRPKSLSEGILGMSPPGPYGGQLSAPLHGVPGSTWVFQASPPPALPSFPRAPASASHTGKKPCPSC